MSSSPSQPATDLREAYRVCEPKPLSGEDFEKYYEPLLDEDDFDAVKAIGASLFVQELGEHKTFFLAGHRGCGKTTQLNLLIKNWCTDYHVIYIEFDNILNINNIDYIDIYLLALFYLNDHLHKHEINIDESIIKEFESTLVKIVDLTVEPSLNKLATDEKILLIKSIAQDRNLKDINLSTDFSLILMGLLLEINKVGTVDRFIRSFRNGKYYNDPTCRGSFINHEKEFKCLFELFLKNINQLIQDSQNTCKGILFIFDNLDRCHIEDSKFLFKDEVSKLFELNCNVIYTAPIYYLTHLQMLNRNYQKSFLVPLSNIYKFNDLQVDLEINELSIKKFTDVLSQRINIDALFDSQQFIYNLILSSGGNLTHLMMLTRQACLSAIGRSRKKINALDVSYAIEQLQIYFGVDSISEKFCQDLAKSFYNKSLPEGNNGFIALKIGLLLQYRDNKRDWFFPHPIITRIDKFKKAIRELEDIVLPTSKTLGNDKPEYSWRNSQPDTM